MFHRVLNTMGIFQKISYTLWITSLILSHPPSLSGQFPKFDRISFLMASLNKGHNYTALRFHKSCGTWLSKAFGAWHRKHCLTVILLTDLQVGHTNHQKN